MRKTTVSPAGHIRQSGIRVHGGPWTVFVIPNPPFTGRLIVALGRRAGGAVVRSRIRRIARDVYEKVRPRLSGADFLLAARGDVGDEPRRRIRGALESLLFRAYESSSRLNTAKSQTRG